MRSVATSGLLTARAAAEKRDSGDPVLVLALGLLWLRRSRDLACRRSSLSELGWPASSACFDLYFSNI